MAQEDLANSGGTYDQRQIRVLLNGVSEQRIDELVRDGILLSVPGPDHQARYPVVQFKHDGTLLEGLQSVMNAMPTRNGFAVLNFLIHPDHRLSNRRPIDLLDAGQTDLVVQAAKRLGEQGA